MTALAEITDALHKLRVSFVQSLVNVAAQRIGAKGMDHGPVLINVSGSTIGIRSMIDEVGQILGLERLYIDITSDGQSFELSLPAGADIDLKRTKEIGISHVLTPVTNSLLVFLLLFYHKSTLLSSF